ncbi:MAG: hypothetical protein O7A03_03535 [Alphaproteobacteria bacterium]|nr:hypothetical protein [Alphaproteobacteria bacterium]
MAQFVQRFGSGAILYDPTGTIEGARRLVRSAAALRGQLKKDLHGIYFVPQSRAAYVVLKPGQFINADKLSVAVLREAENRVRDCFGDTAGPWRSVNIGFSMPPMAAVPVDRASWHRPLRLPGKLPAGTIAATLTALLGMGTAMADGPAVSGFNTKVSLSGGYYNNDDADIDGEAGLVAASLAAPVSFNTRFGVQLDAIAGVIGNDEVWGAGGQLFWRDPDKGLLGAAASHIEVDSDDATRIVGTSEIYLGQFSILANGGYVFGDVKDGAVGGGKLQWYPIDNFMLSGGADYTEETDVTGLAGFEYMPVLAPGFPGLSLFAEGAIGDDFEVGFIGIRFYFGESKTLKGRHRRDDPGNSAFGSLLKDRAPEESYGG